MHDVVYEDVCIKDTKNPIYMDSNYSYRGEATDKLPEFTDIALRNVRILGGGKITLDGFDAAHRLGMLFDNLMFDNPEGHSGHRRSRRVCAWSRSGEFAAGGPGYQDRGQSGEGSPELLRRQVC